MDGYLLGKYINPKILNKKGNQLIGFQALPLCEDKEESILDLTYFQVEKVIKYSQNT